MKVSSTVIIGFVLVLFGVSCSKKESITPPCLLSKITTNQYYPSSTLMSTTAYAYEYDTDFHLTKSTMTYSYSNGSSGTAIFNYTYTNGKVSAMTSPGGAQSTWTHENGHLTKISGTQTGSPAYDVSSLFFYNTQGKLDSVHSTTTTTSYSNTRDFSFAYGSDGNLLSFDINVHGSTGTDLFFHTTYAGYDANYNPYALLAKAVGESNFVSDLEGGIEDYFLFLNNPATASTTGSSTEGRTYTYEFNNHKYATKSTSVENGATLVSTFEYTNCN